MFSVLWVLCFPFFSGNKLNISTHINICNIILRMLLIITIIKRDCRGHDRIVVESTNTRTISADHH